MATTTTTTTTRTARTMDEGLAHYGSHTAIDRGIARAAMTAAGAVAAYTVPSGQYAGFVNAEGTTVGYLHHGYLTVLDTAAAMPKQDPHTGRPMASSGHGSQGWDLYLSAYEAGNGRGPVRVGATCPTCWVAMPLSGAVCFACA